MTYLSLLDFFKNSIKSTEKNNAIKNIIGVQAISIVFVGFIE